MTTSTSAAAAAIFYPLANPKRRAADPMRALEAARSLQVTVNVGSLAAAATARAQGRTWAEIGDALGITKQAAQQRFGIFTDPNSALADHLDRCLYCGDPHQDGPCALVDRG